MDTSLDQVPLANRWWLLTWRDVDPSGQGSGVISIRPFHEAISAWR